MPRRTVAATTRVIRLCECVELVVCASVLNLTLNV